ncbi:hypothetical protein [Coprothermobacter platensis]|uniref:hypothetical protein n=1 Tax=Coprothermobacter platensis TaxID=108819 RepID=UPI00037A26DF|nr:hypothetical protein [Coprothermobacter platensis]
MNSKSSCAFGRYLTFGFHEQWMLSFLNLGEDYLSNNSLGPKQKDALYQYLVDAGFIDRKKQTTELFQTLRLLNASGQLSSLDLWGVVWTEFCHNSAIFLWWANQPIGDYDKETILYQLRSTDKRQRTLTNITNSLISTLQYTPIGKDLKQGEVTKNGRNRIVHKTGHPRLSFLVAVYATYVFAISHDIFSFSLEDVEHYVDSPQTMFCINSAELADALVSSSKHGFFKITWVSNKVFLDLNKELNKVDVIRMCMPLGGV